MSTPLLFGRFEVQPDRRQVLHNGVPVSLGARALDVLLALIERHDRIVSRGELLDIVWAETPVEDNNLTVQIGTLRKALGAEVIATIPGRGYRFTAPPQAEAERPVPPVPASRELRTNLPKTPYLLIGRSGELTEVGVVLAEHRLITITGSGGVGKTRLAQRLMQDRRSDFAHGVGWVELATVSDPSALPAVISAALGLQIENGDPLERLVAAMSSLSMMIALDNAEHLVAGVAHVAQALIRGAPGVKILVTSQAPLHVESEQVFRLAPLAIPQPDATVDDALNHGAVALFVDRARAADRHFVVGASNLAAIVSVCAQVDGVPLAIELAAARVPFLGTAALATLLKKRLHVLTLGRRDASERHHTLRAMLEWSHGILTTWEAAVFSRLGTFLGSFSLEAAARVALDPGDVGLDRWGVIEAIGNLVDRSLVSVEAGEAPRYRLLQITRDFALEQLAARGEEESTRQRHAVVIQGQLSETVTQAFEDHRMVDEAELMLEPDLDNARTSMAWFLSRHDALAAVSMAPFMQFALTSDRRLEQTSLWSLTLPFVTDDLPPSVRARWSTRYASHLIRLMPSQSMAWAKTALLLYEELGDEAGRFEALCMLAMSSARAGEIELCARTCREVEEVDVTRFPVQLQLWALSARFALKTQIGETSELRSLIQRQMALLEKIGSRRSSLILLSNLVASELASDNIVEAIRRGRALEEQLRGHRQPLALCYVRVNLVIALVSDGQLKAAADLARITWCTALMFNVDAMLADHLALMAALSQRPMAAARILGFADARYAEMKTARLAFVKRRVDQVAELAIAALGETEFERSRSKPTVLTSDDILPVALGEMPPH